MATGNVYTGVRARFSISGVKVGYATGVNARESVQWDPIKVLDNIQVTEHAPVDYNVSLTADLVRIVGTTLKSQGWFAAQGGSPEDHLTNILNSGELVATLEDTKSGKIIATVEGVRISEVGLQVTARGIVGQNVSMVAIRMRDESDVA
jgi:hypothetical protein